MRDRIQRLEDHLLASKKKLNEMKTGKPHFRPPSLDTINRTYRNIEAAIEEEASDIALLSSRVSKLDLSGSVGRHSSRRDRRLPDRDASKRPFNVTPSVAITTAAALNAERSAQKLKSALLRVRREPLLNSTAVHVPQVTVPTAFDSPSRSAAAQAAPGPLPATPTPMASSGFFPVTPSGTGSTQAPATPSWSLPPFELPADGDSPSSGSSLRQRSTGSKHHAKPVQLRKNPSPAPAAAAQPSFDWGPLPTFTPRTTLVADVRAANQSPSAGPAATNGGPNLSPGPKAPFSFAGFGGSK
jgi:nucleoporin NUP159